MGRGELPRHYTGCTLKLTSMQFQWLLFDFDNTLVDFTNTSKNALWQSFLDFGSRCTDAIYAQYKDINHQVWTAFERGEMTATHLRIERFARLFEAIEEEPAPPAIFSKRYLENLVALSHAYDGVHELLDELGQNYQLGLITNGLKEVQRPRLELLRMTHHFSTIVVSDEIGVAKPDHAFFDFAYRSLPVAPAKENVLVIGDNLQSDIRGGNNFGHTTCWVSHGRQNESEVQPDFTINGVLGLNGLLS